MEIIEIDINEFEKDIYNEYIDYFLKKNKESGIKFKKHMRIKLKNFIKLFQII